MKKAKKILVGMLLMTLILNLFSFNTKAEASTNGHTVDDAINWVNSKLNTRIGSGQCVALIVAYYEYLGHQSPQIGHAQEYANVANQQPEGWQTLQGVQPQKGDILIYLSSAANPSGHVAIYESDYVTYHQNYPDEYVRKITNRYDQMYDKQLNLMPYWGVIRPDFEERFIPDGSVQDIGDDFIAYITPKTDSNLAVQVTGTGNGADVNLTRRNESSQNQKWYFKKQSDGSYSIKNMYSNNYLDIENTGNTDYENIQVWSGGSGDKQNWFIYSYNGGYRLVPRSSKDNSRGLDIGDDIIDGANLQIHYYVSSTNSWQTFNIVKETTECEHKHTTTHEAVASTCLTHGHAKYVVCDDCGKIISGSDEELPLADHNYGNLIAKVDPIHTSIKLENGVQAHYECSVCGKLFNENKQEVTKEDLIIPAPEHSYGKTWESDDHYHWKQCECGSKIEQEEHKGGEATCISKAVCEVCGKEYGELDPTNHKHTEIRNAVQATTETEGYTGDIYCTDCGKLIKKGEVIPVIESDPEVPSDDNNPTVPDDEDITQPTDEKEEPETVDDSKETTDSSRPKTDDNSNISLWVSLLAISSISFVIIAKNCFKRKVSN